MVRSGTIDKYYSALRELYRLGGRSKKTAFLLSSVKWTKDFGVSSNFVKRAFECGYITVSHANGANGANGSMIKWRTFEPTIEMAKKIAEVESKHVDDYFKKRKAGEIVVRYPRKSKNTLPLLNEIENNTPPAPVQVVPQKQPEAPVVAMQTNGSTQQKIDFDAAQLHSIIKSLQEEILFIKETVVTINNRAFFLYNQFK